MSGEHLKKYARRVISGLDAQGRSTIVSDENSSARVAVPAWTVSSLWQIDSLPASLNDEGKLGEVKLVPPMGSFIYRMATFPPDSEVSASTIRESMEAMGGEDSIANDSDIMGLHAHDTLDIITLIEGELYAVLETTETLLRAGDTFIQCGTKHAWSNRTNKPATLVSINIPAKILA